MSYMKGNKDTSYMELNLVGPFSAGKAVSEFFGYKFYLENKEYDILKIIYDEI